jgi:hypothetical protein
MKVLSAKVFPVFNVFIFQLQFLSPHLTFPLSFLALSFYALTFLARPYLPYFLSLSFLSLSLHLFSHQTNRFEMPSMKKATSSSDSSNKLAIRILFQADPAYTAFEEMQPKEEDFDGAAYAHYDGALVDQASDAERVTRVSALEAAMRAASGQQAAIAQEEPTAAAALSTGASTATKSEQSQIAELQRDLANAMHVNDGTNLCRSLASLPPKCD